jgi:fido (protein-threonine AMPylation protein)
MTLRRFAAGLQTVPAATAWYLADLDKSQGRQELFTRQSPQLLKVLREHALIESAVSSNRIEGVSIAPARIRPVVIGRSLLRDRDEEEVRGYRDAIKEVHDRSGRMEVTEAVVRRLHRLARGQIWDAGKYRTKPCDIIQHYPDGRQRVRFRAVAPNKIAAGITETVSLWRDLQRERTVHPVIALAGFNLDFLCIHPFRDGNGRVSRLLLLLQSYHLGYEVGRYISLERLIEQNKDRYYETLELSSEGWHQGKHNPWHYVNFVLFTLKTAYREFEERLGQVQAPRGAKRELVLRGVRSRAGEFRLADIEQACPGVGREWIRLVLADMKKSGEVTCHGRGPAARWRQVRSKRTTLK